MTASLPRHEVHRKNRLIIIKKESRPAGWPNAAKLAAEGVPALERLQRRRFSGGGPIGLGALNDYQPR